MLTHSSMFDCSMFDCSVFDCSLFYSSVFDCSTFDCSMFDCSMSSSRMSMASNLTHASTLTQQCVCNMSAVKLLHVLLHCKDEVWANAPLGQPSLQLQSQCMQQGSDAAVQTTANISCPLLRRPQERKGLNLVCAAAQQIGCCTVHIEVFDFLRKWAQQIGCCPNPPPLPLHCATVQHLD